MAEFPYTPNPPNVGRFLDHIQDAGVPGKVTNKHLESVGFKSKNDRYIIGALKGIGFLDATGIPTDIWKAYKDKSSAKRVLGEALRTTYADLFSIYPDAYRKDDEALQNYFASKTGLAKPTVERMVSTLKVFCDRAEFEAAPPARSATPPTPLAPATTISTATMPTVSINIELQLPATDDAAVYENLFAAMKKHLFS